MVQLSAIKYAKYSSTLLIQFPVKLRRIIDRHGGDAGVRALDCADIFRVMAFSQLTWRESLRDIESCLASNQSKLFHMGLSGIPARSTLSDALNQRDWRIYHELAMRRCKCTRRWICVVRSRLLFTSAMDNITDIVRLNF